MTQPVIIRPQRPAAWVICGDQQEIERARTRGQSIHAKED